jgi:hypothetical protein
VSGVVALIEFEIDNVGSEASGMVFFQTAPKWVVMITVNVFELKAQLSEYLGCA